MFEFINDEDERGQVGIGTLIVFIAMVLVAAIAAGVLINTAGFLQTQAEETGQDSTDQVANNINVIGTVGEVGSYDHDNDGGTPDINQVDLIRLTVQKSAGSGDIDLGGLSIQYVAPDSFANLKHTKKAPTGGSPESNAAPSVPTYGVEAITANTNEDTVMTKEGDRYQIVIPFKEVGTVTLTKPDNDYDITNSGTSLSNLNAGDSAELTITTASGSQRYVTINVPDSLVNQDGSTVQL
jgi:flagellin FlaB